MSDAPPPPNWGGPPPPPPPPNQPPPGQQSPGPYPANYGQQPPPPYGYQPYGGMMPAEHPQGTTILVLGILSLVVCGILGPFAWSMGSKALREIDANPAPCTNRGSVAAGKICGMIASIILIVVLAFVVIVILATVASSSGSS